MSVLNNTTLSVEVDPTVSFYNRVKGKKEKKKLKRFLAENPSGEELIKTLITSDGALCAVSYTEAPVKEVNDHVERLTKKMFVIIQQHIKQVLLQKELVLNIYSQHPLLDQETETLTTTQHKQL